MKLCTIGLGYIGLPTAVVFALHGVEVVGVDVKEEAVDCLNRGEIHFEEPALQNALHDVWSKGFFRATLTPEKADVFVIAVPTPNRHDTYESCDMTYVLAALKAIIPLLEVGNIIIIESTVAPRMMDDMIKPFIEDHGWIIGENLFVVYCPERVMPGRIMHELIYNNRIIGGITPQCARKAADVFRIFVQGEIITTTAKTAEMTKLIENTYRDVNIALVNELTKICHELHIDVLEVIELANKHPRVQLHAPGPGVGGHCLAVDPYFIVSTAPEEALLIHLSRQINMTMPHFVVQLVHKVLQKIHGERITIFGLTYKGNVDDMRKSPAIDIYQLLKSDTNYDVVAYDPYVIMDFIEPDVHVALTKSDLILILSDHDEFKDLSTLNMSVMNHALIFDTKKIVNNYDRSVQYLHFGNIHTFI